MKHDDLIKALADAGIPLVDRSDMNEYTAKAGNLYLTWGSDDGEVNDLHSTPYTRTATGSASPAAWATPLSSVA